MFAYMLHEGIAVQGLPFQRSENYHLQRAGKEISLVVSRNNFADPLPIHTSLR